MKAYKDPTADAAIGWITKRERIKKILFKDAVYKMAEACGLRVHVTFVKKQRRKRK